MKKIFCSKNWLKNIFVICVTTLVLSNVHGKPVSAQFGSDLLQHDSALQPIGQFVDENIKTSAISDINLLGISSDTFYQWAPNSNLLLFLSLNSNPGGPGLNPYDLILYDPTTGQRIVLASNGYVGQANISDDGLSISFWYNNSPHLFKSITSINSDSQIITEKILVKGAFSKDNKELAYVTTTDEIWVKDLSNGSERLLGIFDGASTFPNLSPEWSPDNQFIAFNGKSCGYIVDSHGNSEEKILTNFNFPQSEYSSSTRLFAWSDDGSALFFNGEMVFSKGSKTQTPPEVASNNFSFDNSYEVQYNEGEIFVREVSSNSITQITSNQEIIEQTLNQEVPPSSDVTAQEVATGFDYPVGKPDGSGYNTTAGCWWLQTTGACAPGPHPGQDFNGNGGGDTDLGDSVYAVANGVVTFSGVGSGTSWGNIILIEHTLPDGSKVWSQYAHLQTRSVSSGTTVSKGDLIGTIGKGYNNIYSAHLHFEIRTQNLSASFWPSGWTTTDVQAYYANPSEFINNHRNINSGISLPSGTTYCAAEGGRCSFTGTATVYYGANNSYYYKENVTGGIDCNNANFGDPISGVTKACYYKITSTPPASGNWHAEYYDTVDRWWDNNNGNNHKCGEDLGGPTLDKNYGSSGPCGMDGDTWIGEYTATINFPANNYVFVLEHDDGMKLWLNGSNIAERSGSSGANDYVCGARYLNGNVSLKAMLREDAGDARIKVYWTTDTSVCNPPAGVPSLTSPANGQSFNEGESVNLSWSATGDQYYGEIWGGPAGTQTFGWQTGTSVNIGSQWAGYTYSWHVKAKNSIGESSYSDTRTFTVKPKQPASLNAVAASCTSVNLTWTDQSGNEEGYKVYRNGTYIGSAGANGTSFTDSGASESTSYSYTVKAYKGSILSDASNTASVTTPTCPVAGTDNSSFVSQSPYPTVQPGEQISLYFTIKNTGTATWKQSDGYYLKNLSNPMGAGSRRELPSDVAPNQQVTFNYTITAPTTPGEYNNGWMMAHNGTQFGVYMFIIVTVPEAPAFDSITSPMVISTIPYTNTQGTTGATQATNDPALIACNRTPGSASVWYKYTSPTSREVSIDTFGSNYDTMIGVWSSVLGNLTEITCNDDTNGLQSSVTFTANAGINYFISISQFTGYINGLEINEQEQKTAPEVSALSGGNLVTNARTFSDVVSNIWYWKWVEGFYAQGITTGCAANPLKYCPDRQVTRAEMAVFLLRAKNGLTTPVPATTNLFADVPVAGKEWMKPWIEEFYNEGITTGCSAAPLKYCPERQVTRAEMAVFVLRAVHGKDYVPPAAAGIFSDVPVAGKAWMQPWIEQFYNEGITTGCASNPLRYCPEQSVTRAEMATFIDRAFGYPQLP